jgi:UDP-N-acetylmuramate dehydrogenase
MNELIEILNQNGIEFETNHSLARHTTWKVGGPAALYIEVKDLKTAQLIIKTCFEKSIPYYVLGGGSNVLISDQGFDGVVIKNNITGIEIHEGQEVVLAPLIELNDVRLEQHDLKNYYSFADLDYDESHEAKVKVTVYSGSLLSLTLNTLISKGITGLQWFAGIPGTIGGAIYNNIHGGSHFFSEYISGVEIINEKGEIQSLKPEELRFGYDDSILQQNKWFILKADLLLFKGDKIKAQQTAIRWAQSKKTKQPYNSAGCCFKNITKMAMERLAFPSNSWGYIVDKQLSLKGRRIGGAKISELHAAFIETEPGATAEDVLQLMELVYTEAEKKLGITPKTEIFFLGFPKERINKFLD